MTSYNFGDVVLVPFPFTDQSGTKKRPAVVVSSASYNNARRDLILAAVTSQVSRATQVGDVEVSEWEGAGLLKPSVIKPILTTIEQRLVIRTLGRLRADDEGALRDMLRVILG
jgi:mRNA interferase MazF